MSSRPAAKNHVSPYSLCHHLPRCTLVTFKFGLCLVYLTSICGWTCLASVHMMCPCLHFVGASWRYFIVRRSQIHAGDLDPSF